ncbi:TetR/AcrR family transcriptional regulator [Amycolatopsis sacchari]|uniref:DNA-binding transcriptional regulator, AcrR family n=1 Tax=Amycolatopsis sacchari TaxID=115433 RepID=A0A1I3QGW8_9PSEU|nr:TetR/AcrR family transcriptional regulator [Amycolatopsis sacchari]SFJ32809.1 DNA-binding transcriptional regulator, AcrR family [Amycolatopsis sacchari]
MTTSRRTQQERREQAENALLRAAAELVVEQGVRSLTLARVSERAGYSRGLVTHHFGAKQVLVERLARAAQAGFVPGLADLSPGLERLLKLIDGYIGALGRLDSFNRAFLLLWTEAATTPELAPIFRERDEAFRTDLREEVAAGLAEGTIRADAEPDDVAIAVVGQLRGIALQRFLSPESVDTERLRRSVTRYWREALARR